MSLEHTVPETNPTHSPSVETTSFSSATARQWLLLLGVGAVTFAIDHLAKWIIVRNLEIGETWVPMPILKNVFDITYTRNTGAAFGLGQGFGDVFLVIAIVVVGIILYYSRRLPHGYWLLRIALGMMMGGATGNALDRVFRGYVVDMFHLHSWPIFNVADSMIVLGVTIWIAVLWWEDHHRKNPATEFAEAKTSE